MIDLPASIARLSGHPITEEMAQDIVGLIAERDRLAAENEQLRTENAVLRKVYVRDAPGGLARRPPGMDRWEK